MNSYDNTNKINYSADRISLDSNIIIDFYENGLEKIISKVLASKIYFSSLILREINRYDLSIFDYEEIVFSKDTELEYFNNLYSKFSNKLTASDVHLITICKFNNLICGTNEKYIRKICEKEKIKVFGTISILKEAVKADLIDNYKARNILEKMKKSTMYLSQVLYDKVLKDFNL